VQTLQIHADDKQGLLAVSSKGSSSSIRQKVTKVRGYRGPCALDFLNPISIGFRRLRRTSYYCAKFKTIPIRDFRYIVLLALLPWPLTFRLLNGVTSHQWLPSCQFSVCYALPFST